MSGDPDELGLRGMVNDVMGSFDVQVEAFAVSGLGVWVAAQFISWVEPRRPKCLKSCRGLG